MQKMGRWRGGIAPAMPPSPVIVPMIWALASRTTTASAPAQSGGAGGDAHALGSKCIWNGGGAVADDQLEPHGPDPLRHLRAHVARTDRGNPADGHGFPSPSVSSSGRMKQADHEQRGQSLDEGRCVRPVTARNGMTAPSCGRVSMRRCGCDAGAAFGFGTKRHVVKPNCLPANQHGHFGAALLSRTRSKGLWPEMPGSATTSRQQLSLSSARSTLKSMTAAPHQRGAFGRSSSGA